MKKTLYSAGLLALSPILANAATVTLNANNGTGGNFVIPFTDSSSNRLPVGSLIEIGYFDGLSSTPSSQADFATFTAITSANSAVGNNADGSTSPAGEFSTANFILTDGGVDIPNGLLFYGLRIYDGTSVATSNNFNVVAADPWNTTPIDGVPSPGGDGQVTLSAISGFLAPDGLIWQDAANPGSTTIAVPEPSSVLLSALGLLALAGRRKRA